MNLGGCELCRVRKYYLADSYDAVDVQDAQLPQSVDLRQRVDRMQLWIVRASVLWNLAGRTGPD